MANKLYHFTCQNRACDDRENYVELPEGQYKRTKYLVYCWSCGACLVSDAKKDVLISEGKSWLPCIAFTGTGSRMTRGPVSDELGGYKWGDPVSNANLTEEEFMLRYLVNPRRQWCKRTNHKNKSICKPKEACKPVDYGKVDVIVPPPPQPWPIHRNLTNRRRG
jgi:hypothetical protein